MRFQRIQEIVLLAFAGLGLGLLLLSGAAGPLFSAVAVLAFLLSLFTPKAWMASRRWQRLWTLAAVGVVGGLASAAATGTPILTVTAQAALYFQIHKLFHRTAARDHEQIALLSLAHVAFATILFSGLRYALLLVFFVALSPLLLALLHLRREIEQKYAGPPEGGRDEQTLARVLRTRRVATRGFVGVLLASSVPLLLLTAVFFLALPRLGFGFLAGRTRGSFLVGFSDRMELGDLTPLGDDPTPVMRVEFPDGAPSTRELADLRFRGTAFDVYDGRAWRRVSAPDPAAQQGSFAAAYDLPAPGPDPVSTRRVRLLQEPLEPRLLFLPAGTRSFTYRGPMPRRPGPPRPPVEWLADGIAAYRESGDEGVPVDVVMGRWNDGVRTPGPGLWRNRWDDDPYLQLPPGSEAQRRLAREIAGGLADPRARAEAIARYLRTHYRYTRTTHAESSGRPLDDFLFRWKEGYCEYFSSAMTLLARAVGLRARNVSGFIGGHWNEVGEYLVVRQSNAHSWAEVEIPGEGWLVFDATPAAEEEGTVTRTGGVFGWLGDTLDALRTAWNRHVIAFDLKRQLGILRALADGVRAARDGLVSLTHRHGLVLGLAAVLAGGGLALWLLRRRLRRLAGSLRGGPGRLRATGPDPRDRAEARRLLGDLERRLKPLGIERSLHEPVERLAERALPRLPALHAATAAALDRYQATRFGGRPLTSAERRSLLQEVARAARPA